jgi:outer membrane murein-binding lipoprotein Lpp
MKRLQFWLPATALCALLTGGCTGIVEFNSAQYAQEAARKRELAAKEEALGDKEAAERYAREARVADSRAEQKRAEEEYIAETKDREVSPKSLPAPSNLPSP